MSQTLAALSDQNRQKILDILKKGEKNVSEINAKLNITMATLSHHLDILKRCDLVSCRRDGREIYYSLNLSVMEEITEQVIKLLTIKKK